MGVLLVHSEIYYVPGDDGWEEVLVRNVLHYIPIAAIAHLVYLLDRSSCAVAKSQRVSNKTGLELMIRLCLQNL